MKWKLTLIAACWYSASSLNNVVGKRLLNIHPHPLTLTFIQLLSISLLSLTLLRKTKKTKIETNIFYKFIIPLSIAKFIASVASHVSIWAVPVSYAHTVKATTPLFTIVITKILYKTVYPTRTYLSLVPIITGVLLATLTEINYNNLGLISALLSTLAFSLQNIFSKQVLKITCMHHFQLLSILARTSFVIFTPIYLMLDWSLFKILEIEIYYLLLLDGLLSFAQHLLAFSFLGMVSPLGYSVANSVKRIFIIGLSVVVFGNGVGLINWVGIVLSVFGVLCYNLGSSTSKKDKLLPLNNNDVYV